MAQRRAEYICILIAAILFYAFCTDFISLFTLLNVLFRGSYMLFGTFA